MVMEVEGGGGGEISIDEFFVFASKMHQFAKQN